MKITMNINQAIAQVNKKLFQILYTILAVIIQASSFAQSPKIVPNEVTTE